MTAVAAFGDDDEPVPVDTPHQRQSFDATVLGARTIDHRPVIPPWLRNRAEFRALVVWLARHGMHISAFHLARIPCYVARLITQSPRGGWRVAVLVANWVLDREQAPIREGAIQRGAVAEYLSLSKQRRERVKQRATFVGCGLRLVVGGVLIFRAHTSTTVQVLLAVALTLTLGVVGTPADRRVLDVAMVSPLAPPRLTADSVTAALRALGISEINKKGATITYTAPITRDGPGWRADVDLPLGVTPQYVMEKRRELASALRRPLGCVWPEPAGEHHAGRLVLWVGDQDLAKAKQPSWPLARSGSADLFGAVPFGCEQRGRVVTVTLMFASMVIGSIPRVGKTFSLRLLLLAAALDVRAELHCFDLKGTGDLSALEPVAHAYRAGDDVDDIVYPVEDMRALAIELRRRTKVIQTLPRDLCPENKITPELAGRGSLGLHPIAVGCDECQRWFENPAYGKELTTIAEDLVRRGPAAGITAVFPTQRPDARSLPTGISGNAILRFALKVMDHSANDMILGTSARKNGIKATMFTRRSERVPELLAELRPQVYGSWSPEALAAALRPDQVSPQQVWIDGSNVRGYKIEHVLAALDRRSIGE